MANPKQIKSVSKKLETLRLSGVFSKAVKAIGPGLLEPENHNCINAYVTRDLNEREKAVIEREAENIRVRYIKLKPR